MILESLGLVNNVTHDDLPNDDVRFLYQPQTENPNLDNERHQALVEISKVPFGQKGNFSTSDFRGADLSYRFLRGFQFRFGDFRGANLNSADLEEANLSTAYFGPLIEGEYISADRVGADLRSANLRRAILYNADLNNALLSNASLNAAYLHKASMFYTDLSYADLSEADLSESVMVGTNLNFANLSNADLNKVVIKGVDLERVGSMVHAGLSGGTLTEIEFNPEERTLADKLRFTSYDKLKVDYELGTYLTKYGFENLFLSKNLRLDDLKINNKDQRAAAEYFVKVTKSKSPMLNQGCLAFVKYLNSTKNLNKEKITKWLKNYLLNSALRREYFLADTDRCQALKILIHGFLK